MKTTTLHALPSCSADRIFELRRAARDAGARYVVSRRRLVSRAPSPSPQGGDAA